MLGKSAKGVRLAMIGSRSVHPPYETNAPFAVESGLALGTWNQACCYSSDEPWADRLAALSPQQTPTENGLNRRMIDKRKVNCHSGEAKRAEQIFERALVFDEGAL